MKPAFALDFRNDAIALLHRLPGGWQQIGSVTFDEPDLPGALSYLRSTALGLSPRGIATKLILPNEQILFTQVDAPGPDEASRLAQIRAALEGRTPYDVADLAFDWWLEGDAVHVAAVARETLAEAEGFAAEHRFNPVSFVAVPEGARSMAEAFFGPSSLADSLLAAGEVVEADTQAVAITGRGFEPEAEVAPVAEVFAEAAPEPAFEADIAPEPVAEPAMADLVAEEVAAFEAEVQPEPEPEPVYATAPEPEYSGDPAPEAGAPEIPPVAFDEEPEVTPENETVFAAEPEPAPEPAPRRWMPPEEPEEEFITPPEPMRRWVPPPEPDEVEPEDLLAADPELATPAAETPADLSGALSGIVLEEAPMAENVEEEEASATPAAPHAPQPSVTSLSVTDPGLDEDLPPAPGWTPAMGFASRRASADPAAGKVGKTAPPPLRAPVDRPTAAKPVLSNAAAPKVDRPAAPRPAAAPKLAAKDGKGALRGLGALVTAPGIAGSRKRKAAPVTAPVASATPAAAAVAKPQTPARSPLGGLGGRPVPQRGKPRHLGLILTLILLLCLLLIAAWSTTLAFRDSGSDEVQLAAAESSTTVAPDADLPSPDDEMLADMQDPAELAEAAEAVAAPEVLDPAPEQLAAAGPEATNPSASAVQDEIFLATMDAAPAAPDPSALPTPEARGDPLPALQAAPPPFGTVYQFDENGLIKATPEGIITPEGVRLVAGRPALVPAPRPQSVIDAAAAASPVAASQGPAVAADQPFASDPALSQFRPKARPAGLAPAAADDASLAPAADSRFASLRPRARPQAIVAAGEAARQASAAASLAAQAEADAAAAASGPASKMAVAISRKPAPRPRDLSRAVEAAVAAAVRQPEPKPEAEPEPEPKAKAEPEADDEPEIASNTRIPQNASVAKQATFKNAINLGKTSLIGVYGTQSKRYAMVRTEAGRYKKVRIGDKVDGGTVKAITANEVRYQKGSKLLTLAMPKG